MFLSCVPISHPDAPDGMYGSDVAASILQTPSQPDCCTLSPEGKSSDAAGPIEARINLLMSSGRVSWQLRRFAQFDRSVASINRIGLAPATPGPSGFGAVPTTAPPAGKLIPASSSALRIAVMLLETGFRCPLSKSATV